MQDALQYIMEYSVLENLEQLVIEHDVDNIVLWSSTFGRCRALPRSMFTKNRWAALRFSAFFGALATGMNRWKISC